MIKKNSCPPFVPVCPLPKALKGQIISQGPRAGSNPAEGTFASKGTSEKWFRFLL